MYLSFEHPYRDLTSVVVNPSIYCLAMVCGSAYVDPAREEQAMLAVQDIVACAHDVPWATIMAFRTVIASLPGAINLPQVATSEDGEIGLSWFRGADRFEAMLGPESGLAWITLVNGSFHPGQQIIVKGRDSLGPFLAALTAFHAPAQSIAA